MDGDDDSVSEILQPNIFHATNGNVPRADNTSEHIKPVTPTRNIKSKPKSPKKLIQPPMWSTRPKPLPTPLPPEVPVKEPPPVLKAPPVYVDRRSGLEEEFDPFKFLQKLKTKAINYSQKKKFRPLSELFSVAINRFPTNPNFHCNRSFAFQKMEYYGKALDDANKALQLNDEHKMAYQRRAAAYLGLGMLVNALEDYEQLMKLCPKSTKIKCKYLHCQKALNRCIFESLMTDNMSEHEIEHLVNFENINIENSYPGPRLKTEKVNASFIWTLMKYFRSEGLLHRKYVYKILFDLEALLKTLPSLVNIDVVGLEDVIIICGDIQGQYYDLNHIFDQNGFPSGRRKYLFNGNFIGKGSFSLEVAIILFAFKIAYPNRFFIARGHHETLAMTKMFGFETAVSTKYSPVMFQIFTRIFQWLPLAHVINNKVLVVHGGLFQEDNVTLDDIRELKRNLEPAEGNPKLTDILWSDPQSENGKQKNFRGMGGILFGPDVTQDFLERNNLEYIIRSHEYKPQGFSEDHEGKCITLFSAPNYCDTYGNKGSYMVLTGKELTSDRVLIDAQKHPNIPPLFYAESIYRILT